jgi:glycosyltransferase involved in cell wall biosynthesis
VAREKLGIGKEDKVILFFGLIRHYKGLDLLIEGFAKSAEQLQDLKLLIAGEFYEDKQPYLDLIDKLNMRSRIILHDRFIGNDDVKYYFCASDLVAQTYRNATNSGVTMVGYYYSKPMLVTNTGGLAEIVPDGVCGFVVEKDPTRIAEKITEYFLTGKEKEFTRNVTREKTKFEWTTFIAVLLKLYEEVRTKRK